MSQKITVHVSDSIGSVSCLIDEPENPLGILILAHGAGAPMDHSFLQTLAEKLIENNIVVFRFNFPYMEKKSKRPDVAAVAEKTVAVMLEKAHDLFPTLPLFVSGKSFGGRMSSQRLSKDCPDFVKGIIFYGFPLHPSGKPSTDRADHLHALKIPMLFLQGTKDTLATLDLINEVTNKLPTSNLITYEGADHSFKKGKKLFMDELVRDTIEWIVEIKSI